MFKLSTILATAGSVAFCCNVYATDRIPLIEAVKDKDQIQVESLLEANANVDATDRFGKTALVWAAILGFTDIAAILIKSGAYLESTDAGGNTPLIIASYHGHVKLLELLLKSGANVNAVSKNGSTAKSWANRAGRPDWLIDEINRLIDEQIAKDSQKEDAK